MDQFIKNSALESVNSLNLQTLNNSYTALNIIQWFYTPAFQVKNFVSYNRKGWDNHFQTPAVSVQNEPPLTH